MWVVTPLLIGMVQLHVRTRSITSSDAFCMTRADSWKKTQMIERRYVTTQEEKKRMSYRIQFPDLWWRMTHHDVTHKTNMMYTNWLFECGRQKVLLKLNHTEHSKYGIWPEYTKLEQFGENDLVTEYGMEMWMKQMCH